MSKRPAVLSCAAALAALFAVGCPEAHDRRVYPIIDVTVDDATCASEGIALGSGSSFTRRFGPYTPVEGSRWLGGSVAWSRDGATLVASQDSRFETSGVGERAPSSEGLVVFDAERSCARAVAFLDAPTDELGASLAISPSGGFIAATGYVPRPLADGFEYTAPAAHVFTREGASFVSRAPIPSSGFARVAFVGERLGLLHSIAAPSQLAVFTLGATTVSITDLIRSEGEESGVNIAASSSGEYAAIVSLEGAVTRARFEGDSSTFTTVHEPGVYDGLLPTVSVADTGRVALFQGEGGRGAIRILDGRTEGPIFITGWPGYAFNSGAAAISPSGERIAWTMTNETPTGTNFNLVVADIAPDGSISRPSEVALTDGCDAPWFVRSVAFAADGRLAVGAMCSEARGAIFILE